MRRRGIKYFAAGNFGARKPFANFLFPHFEDEDKDEYFSAASEFLRMAKSTRQIIPRSSNKAALGPVGTLCFTCDAAGYMYGIVCSNDYPLKLAFGFLQDMLNQYVDVSIKPAIDGTDVQVWSNPHFSTDIFGIRPLAIELWQRYARPEDGYAKERSIVMLAQ